METLNVKSVLVWRIESNVVEASFKISVAQHVSRETPVDSMANNHTCK
jgi:hypothetical protein